MINLWDEFEFLAANTYLLYFVYISIDKYKIIYIILYYIILYISIIECDGVFSIEL